jgi:hypothetical protein
MTNQFPKFPRPSRQTIAKVSIGQGISRHLWKQKVSQRAPEPAIGRFSKPEEFSSYPYETGSRVIW